MCMLHLVLLCRCPKFSFIETFQECDIGYKAWFIVQTVVLNIFKHVLSYAQWMRSIFYSFPLCCRCEGCCCIFLQLSSFPSGKRNLSPSSLPSSATSLLSAPHILRLEKLKGWFIVLYRQSWNSLLGSVSFPLVLELLHNHCEPMLLINSRCWGRNRGCTGNCCLEQPLANPHGCPPRTRE